jgi:beta-aspartyl-peptidase (threonine type)
MIERIRTLVAVFFAATTLVAGPAHAESNGQARWSVAIHGGAGVIERKDLSPETEAAYRAALTRATEAAAAVLDDGGTALDAVETAIRLMEDDPLFNAGRGAVFTSKGTNELDAAIMDGATLKAGAVAGVTGVRNPIRLARRVMEASPHVMMIGSGAEAFAAEQGLERAEPAWFFTERRWRSLVEVLTERGDPVPPRPEGAPLPGAAVEAAPIDERKFGTVGVVALDVHGNLAAGTSTGGTTGKRWGRVGDAPVIGAGTYASNRGCAVSATGTGEYFIRLSVARTICALMELRGMSAQAAADQVIGHDLTAIGGDGGAIVLSPRGEAAFSMNTSGMYRGSAASDRPVSVAIFADEK